MTNISDLPDIRQRLGDRYAIERELERGGMGTVYLARDLRLDRPVALKVLPAEFTRDSSLRERFLRETLTRVGEVVGTAEYMSPEQASGDVVDGRSDLYSLGLIALFALTGRPAITGESTQQILVKQLTETPPPATSLRPDLPESLGAAIDRCVAKEPSARFATAEALVEATDDARLAPPEIPVPIRLFAQEAETLSLVIVFLTMISWLFFEMLSRKTVIVAVFLLPIALLLINRSLNVGFSFGTKAEVAQTESREPAQRSLGRLVTAALALSLLGVGFLLLARSPFRMPPGERLFRIVWLGAPGRAFVRFSSRNVTPPSSGKTAPGLAGTRANVNIAETGRDVAPVVATTTTPTDRMRSLEDRVAALERWRDGASTSRD